MITCVQMFTITFENCTSAEGDGGAVAIQNVSTSNITLTEVLNSTAAGDGGAFIVKDVDAITFNSSFFKENSAGRDGGARKRVETVWVCLALD